MLNDHIFDDSKIKELITQSDIVNAHNSNFDRKFHDRRFPELAQTKWACSLKDIDWYEKRLSSRSLEFLCFKHGFSYIGSPYSCKEALKERGYKWMLDGKKVWHKHIEDTEIDAEKQFLDDLYEHGATIAEFRAITAFERYSK